MLKAKMSVIWINKIMPKNLYKDKLKIFFFLSENSNYRGTNVTTNNGSSMV